MSQTDPLLAGASEVRQQQGEMISILDVDPLTKTPTFHSKNVLTLLKHLERNMKLIVLSVSGEAWEEKNYFISAICEYLAQCESEGKSTLTNWHESVATIHNVKQPDNQNLGVTMLNRPFVLPVNNQDKKKIAVLIMTVVNLPTNTDDVSSDFYSFLLAHHHLVYQGDQLLASPLLNLEGRVVAAQHQTEDLPLGNLLLIYGKQRKEDCKGVISYTGEQQNIPRKLREWSSSLKEVSLPRTGARPGVLNNMEAPVDVKDVYRPYLEEVARMMDQLLSGIDYDKLKSVSDYRKHVQKQQVSREPILIPSEEQVKTIRNAQERRISFLNAVNAELGAIEFKYCCQPDIKGQMNNKKRMLEQRLIDLEQQYPDQAVWTETRDQLELKFGNKQTKYDEFSRRRCKIRIGIASGCACMAILVIGLVSGHLHG